MANANTPMKKKLGSKYKAAGVVILILLLIAAAFFIFKSCSAQPDGDTGSRLGPKAFRKLSGKAFSPDNMLCCFVQ